jgi:hypothetical protein
VSLSRITSENLSGKLVAAVPEFAPVLEEHQKDYGEVLNHVLFGDLVRFVEKAEGRGDWELIDRSLAFLEEALASGDEQVVNVIEVSFVENLEPWTSEHEAVFSRFPARLRATLEAQRNCSPP